MNCYRPYGIGSFAALLVAFLLVYDAAAQDLHPSRRPSPIGIAKTQIGDTYVKVTYGRPYIRGRDIFGTDDETSAYLVPFGEIWRTGANEATEITVTEDVMIGGERLEAGTYSIFTEPNAETWVIHISPHLGLDGTGIFNPQTNSVTEVFDPADNVLTLDAPSNSIDETVEQFTIRFDESDSGADLVMSWENTEIRLPIEPAT